MHQEIEKEQILCPKSTRPTLPELDSGSHIWGLSHAGWHDMTMIHKHTRMDIYIYTIIYVYMYIYI